MGAHAITNLADHVISPSTMTLLQKFVDHIRLNNLFSSKNKLLLAVSGGVDSIVLCELCKQAGFEFEIAHCNFQLRGQESEHDEQFVKGLAERYSVQFHSRRFDTEKFAHDNQLSIQEGARKLRYDWFNELLSAVATPGSQRPTLLLTAHHADDSVETLLMNFFRGT